MTYTILMLCSVTEAWPRLSHNAREAFNDEVLEPILSRYADKVKVRLLDCEAFCASVSDFTLVETKELSSFYSLIEALREPKFYSEPFIRVRDLSVGVGRSFRTFEEMQSKGEAA